MIDEKDEELDLMMGFLKRESVVLRRASAGVLGVLLAMTMGCLLCCGQTAPRTVPGEITSNSVRTYKLVY
ncbi:MAG: hypothetical protein ABII00_05295 [Elusimicrobiota bacterium]